MQKYLILAAYVEPNIFLFRVTLVCSFCIARIKGEQYIHCSLTHTVDYLQPKNEDRKRKEVQKKEERRDGREGGRKEEQKERRKETTV